MDLTWSECVCPKFLQNKKSAFIAATQLLRSHLYRVNTLQRTMAKRVRRNVASEQTTPFQSFPLLHSRNAGGISCAPKALRILKNSCPTARLSGNPLPRCPDRWVFRKVIRHNNGIGDEWRECVCSYKIKKQIGFIATPCKQQQQHPKIEEQWLKRNLASEQSTPFQSFPLLRSRNIIRSESSPDAEK
ncbi:hypothetical protein CDAR_602001 [Caerostris darwini]|uniref:Uncharacterized protein n=1 Tax=Caerostris darwini TaxID=1538125 RepID=A0AAV4SIZ4_9ARAC|nr:hypothetical protein CDAR_602001 [Caerostris darwini]